MVRNILTLVLALAAVFSLGSCLGSDDETDVEYSEDTALSSFTLGSTINRYYYVKSSTGNDSLVKTTFSGSSYAMTIDHQRGLVYNTDSLPYGTDLKHLLVTASAYNSGTVVIKDINSDTLRYISSTDSLDFSQTREVRVYSQSGASMRAYKVTLYAHQVPTDTTVWSHVATNAQIGNFNAMKAVCLNGNILVIGQNGDKACVYSSGEDDGTNWTLRNQELGAEAASNAIVSQGQLFVLDGTQLKSSTDGASFTSVGTTPLLRLVAASTKRLYALNTDKRLVESTDLGVTWTESPLDDDAALLPTGNIGYTCYPSETSNNADNLLIVGTRGNSENDSITYAWTRIERYGNGDTSYPWNFVDDGEYSTMRLPAMQSLVILPLGDGALAIGGAGIYGSSEKAFSHTYLSVDGGIRWRTDSGYRLPSGFKSSATSFAATIDSKGRIWLFGGQTGQVWRGFLIEE